MRRLAIDPGSHLGWSTDATGLLEWGTEDFSIQRGESSGNRWRRFGEWLFDTTMKEEPTRMVLSAPRRIESDLVHKVDLIVYEQQLNFNPRMRRSAEIGFGFTSRLEEHCERHGIALQPVNVQTLKAFAIPKVKRKKGDPKMDRGKAAMIEAANQRLLDYGLIGHNTGVNYRETTEHEADALWLLWWAKENCG
jgi:hypothetical protein